MKIHHYYVHNESLALEETSCRECESVFSYYPSDKDGIYCSVCVDSDDVVWHGEPPTGEDHPCYAGRVTKRCKWCTEEMSLTPSEAEDRYFCGLDCYTEWMSEERVGRNHPRWKGGYSDCIGGGWNSQRKKALERDNYNCQNCGVGEDDLPRNPDVHHIVPRVEFDEMEEANELDNLITLCRDCHSSVESGEIEIDRNI